jgi:hypothetical protein
MSAEPSQPSLHEEWVAAGRTYAWDLIASLILFVSAALIAGRVWRFPFDDELYTLAIVERSHSAWEVLSFFLRGNDIQPPLADVTFYALHHMGLSEAAMRLCSLAMTALSLELFHCLTLAIVGERTQAPVRSTTRLIAVLLFGLSPLAISMGDAIRWYPLFALLFSLFFTLYLVAGNSASRLGSAAALGLAASTNFLAAIVIIPFLLYRYLLQRQFRPSFEIPYWLIFSLFGSPGFISAVAIAIKPPQSIVEHQFGYGLFQALAIDGLGFFGGDAVGVSQVWLIIPVALIAACALFREIDRRHSANPVHLFLLMFGAMALMVLAGFAKPRSFLYLAPVLAAILTFFLDRRSPDRQMGGTALLVAAILIASVGAVANLNHGSTPFKRNAAIPYEDLLDFIRANERGNVLVASSDAGVVWVLRHQGGHEERCVSYFAREAACFAADRHYDSIFVISGHSNRSSNVLFMNRFDAALQGVLGGRTKVAELHIGRDEDAALKSRLTGVPLDLFILTVDLYR